MAARKNLKHAEKTKERIQTSMLINRLENYILGKVEMSGPQVTAALGLLKKTTPDMSSVEMKAEIEQTNYVVDSNPLSVDEWSQEHKPSGSPSQGHNTH